MRTSTLMRALAMLLSMALITFKINFLPKSTLHLSIITLETQNQNSFDDQSYGDFKGKHNVSQATENNLNINLNL